MTVAGSLIAAGRVLENLDFTTMEMLRLFRESQSFLAVAAEVERDERVVSRRLLELNAAMLTATGVELLVKARGRRGYVLTKEGEYFSIKVEDLMARARESVAAMALSNDTLAIPCSSTCLAYFQKLQVSAATMDIELRPDPRRSAEFPAPPAKLTRSIVQGGDYGLSFFTVATDRTGDFAMKRRQAYHDAWEVLPIRVETFRVLAPRSLTLPESLTFEGLLEHGFAIWIPAGGAAWQFTQLVSPGWETRFPLQFHQTPDFEFGIQCLTREIEPRKAVMVVHGEVAVPRKGAATGGDHTAGGEYWLSSSEQAEQVLKLYEFEGEAERATSALTGLFCHTTPDLTSEERSRWTRVWELSPLAMFS